MTIKNQSRLENPPYMFPVINSKQKRYVIRKHLEVE